MAQSPTRQDIEEKRDEVAANLKELIASADDLLRTTASYSGAEIEAARERLSQQLERAKADAQDYRQSLKAGLQTVAQATDECVHKHAWTAVGVAAIFGLLVGKCLGADPRRC